MAGVMAAAKREGFSTFQRAAKRAFARLRISFWPVVQTAVAATLAWWVAAFVLGHDRPFVAAIAAVISIGAVAGQTLKRAAEWIFGIAVGLAVADLIMLAIGTGPVQTGVIVGLAMFAALLMRGGIGMVTEAGVSAVLVANLDPATYGVSPDRFLEALVGGGVALAISAAFPSNPIARFSPPRRRHLGHLAYYATAADQLDLAVRDTRVLARAAVTLVREKGVAPRPLAEAILELALAVEALAGYPEHSDHSPRDTRDFALGAAGV